jgi:hypothetical protein
MGLHVKAAQLDDSMDKLDLLVSIARGQRIQALQDQVHVLLAQLGQVLYRRDLTLWISAHCVIMVTLESLLSCHVNFALQWMHNLRDAIPTIRSLI